MRILFFLILFCVTNTLYSQKPWQLMSLQEKTTNAKVLADKIYANIEESLPEDRRAYIKRFGWLAIYDYNEYGVFASVKLAQGGLECGFGNIMDRGLQGNNHFSIKCRGKNHKNHNCFILNDGGQNCHFIRYKNAFDSFRGHTIHLRTYYKSLFKETNYRSWTAVLGKKYAVDKKYAAKLNNIIKDYYLTQYDVKI